MNQFYVTLKAMRIKTFFLISILLASAGFGFAFKPRDAINFEKKFSSFYNKLKPIQEDKPARNINFEKRFSSFYNRLKPIQEYDDDVDDNQERDYNQIKRISNVNPNYMICLWYASLCNSNGQPPAGLTPL